MPHKRQASPQAASGSSFSAPSTAMPPTNYDIYQFQKVLSISTGSYQSSNCSGGGAQNAAAGGTAQQHNNISTDFIDTAQWDELDSRYDSDGAEQIGISHSGASPLTRRGAGAAGPEPGSGLATPASPDGANNASQRFRSASLRPGGSAATGNRKQNSSGADGLEQNFSSSVATALNANKRPVTFRQVISGGCKGLYNVLAMLCSNDTLVLRFFGIVKSIEREDELQTMYSAAGASMQRASELAQIGVDNMDAMSAAFSDSESLASSSYRSGGASSRLAARAAAAAAAGVEDGIFDDDAWSAYSGETFASRQRNSVVLGSPSSGTGFDDTAGNTPVSAALGLPLAHNDNNVRLNGPIVRTVTHFKDLGIHISSIAMDEDARWLTCVTAEGDIHVVPVCRIFFPYNTENSWPFKLPRGASSSSAQSASSAAGGSSTSQRAQRKAAGIPSLKEYTLFASEIDRADQQNKNFLSEIREIECATLPGQGVKRLLNCKKHGRVVQCAYWRSFENKIYALLGTEAGYLAFFNLQTQMEECVLGGFKQGIQKMDFIVDPKGTFRYLLVHAQGGFYYRLTLEQEDTEFHCIKTITEHYRDETIASLFDYGGQGKDKNGGGGSSVSDGPNARSSEDFRPMVFAELSKEFPNVVTVQNTSSKGPLICSFSKLNSQLSVYDPETCRFPLYVFQLNSETAHLFSTDHLLFSVQRPSSNESILSGQSAERLWVVSKLLTGLGTQSPWTSGASKTRTSAVFQEFVLPRSQHVLGFIPGFTYHRVKPKSGRMFEDTLLGADELGGRRFAAEDNDEDDDENEGEIEGSFIWTQNAVYELRQKRSPRSIFQYLLSSQSDNSNGGSRSSSSVSTPQDLDSGNGSSTTAAMMEYAADQFGKTFRLNLFGLYEQAADKAFEKGDLDVAFRLYGLSNVSETKLVRRLMQSQQTDVVLQFLTDTLRNQSSLSLNKRRQLSDLLFSAYLFKLTTPRQQMVSTTTVVDSASSGIHAHFEQHKRRLAERNKTNNLYDVESYSAALSKAMSGVPAAGKASLSSVLSGNKPSGGPPKTPGNTDSRIESILRWNLGSLENVEIPLMLEDEDLWGRFRSFLLSDSNFNVTAALQQLVAQGFFALAIEVAHAHDVMPRALNQLINHGCIQLNPTCIAFLLHHGYAKLVLSSASGILIKACPPSIRLRFFINGHLRDIINETIHVPKNPQHDPMSLLDEHASSVTVVDSQQAALDAYGIPRSYGAFASDLFSPTSPEATFLASFSGMSEEVFRKISGVLPFVSEMDVLLELAQALHPESTLFSRTIISGRGVQEHMIPRHYASLQGTHHVELYIFSLICICALKQRQFGGDQPQGLGYLQKSLFETAQDKLEDAIKSYGDFYRSRLIMRLCLQYDNKNAIAVLYETHKQWYEAVCCRLSQIRDAFKTEMQQLNTDKQEMVNLAMKKLLSLMDKYLVKSGLPTQEAQRDRRCKILTRILHYWYDLQLPVKPMEEYCLKNMHVLSESLGIMLMAKKLEDGGSTAGVDSTSSSDPPTDSSRSSSAGLLAVPDDKRHPFMLAFSHRFYLKISQQYVKSIKKFEKSESQSHSHLQMQILRNLEKDVDTRSRLSVVLDQRMMESNQNVVAFTCEHRYLKNQFLDVILPEFVRRTKFWTDPSASSSNDTTATSRSAQASSSSSSSKPKTVKQLMYQIALSIVDRDYRQHEHHHDPREYSINHSCPVCVYNCLVEMENKANAAKARFSLAAAAPPDQPQLRQETPLLP